MGASTNDSYLGRGRGRGPSPSYGGGRRGCFEQQQQQHADAWGGLGKT